MKNSNGLSSSWGKPVPVLEITLVFLQILYLIWTRLFQNLVFIDDAHIHFRIAENLAAGHGLVYNIGERFLATTSPVWSLLLGIAHWATHIEVKTLAQFLSFLADVGLMLMALGWLRRAGMPLIVRHAVVLGVSAEGLVMFHSAAGMEMSLFLVAGAVVIELASRSRWIGAGAVLGILGWIRPEGAAVALALIAALAIVREWRGLVRIVAAAVGSALLFGALLWALSGGVIPLSVHIKSVAPWFVNHRENAFMTQNDTLMLLSPLTPLERFYMIWPPAFEPVHTGFLVLLQAGLMALAGIWLVRRGQTVLGLALPLWALAQTLFHIVGDSPLMAWHLVPLLWLGVLLGGTGLWAAVAPWAERSTRSQTRHLAEGCVALVIALLLFASSAHRTLVFPIAGEARLFLHRDSIARMLFRFRSLEEEPRWRLYRQAAEVANEHFGDDPSVTVGLHEIGIFGQVYHGRVVDGFGIVTPEVTGLVDEPGIAGTDWRSRRVQIKVLLRLRPEVIALPTFLGLEYPEDFEEHYERLPIESEGMIFWGRRDWVEESGARFSLSSAQRAGRIPGCASLPPSHSC